MLDLTQVKKYYELKWFDGEILHLNMPSQEILMKIMKLEELEDVEEQLVQFKNIMVHILQDNKEKRVFSDEEINELSLDIIQLILEDYLSSVNAVLGE